MPTPSPSIDPTRVAAAGDRDLSRDQPDGAGPDQEADQGHAEWQAHRHQRSEGQDQHDDGDAHADQLALRLGGRVGVAEQAAVLDGQPGVAHRCDRRLGLVEGTSSMSLVSKVTVEKPIRPSGLSMGDRASYGSLTATTCGSAATLFEGRGDHRPGLRSVERLRRR